MTPELHNHLQTRDLDVTRYTSVQVFGSVVVFWLHNLSGKMVGYLEYRYDKEKLSEDFPRSERRYYPFVSTSWDGKFRSAQLAVWGLETVQWTDQYLFVVEGVFDAVKLHRLGLPCVAVMSCNPNHLDSWFRTLPQRKVVVCDDDAAGYKLAKHGDEVVTMTNGRDPGDYSLAALREFAPLQKYLKD